MFRQRTRSGGAKASEAAPTPERSSAHTSQPATQADPSAPHKKAKLSFSDVAALFIRMRRFSLRAGVGTPNNANGQSVEVPSKEPHDDLSSPPLSPTKSTSGKRVSYASIGKGRPSSPTPVVASPPASPIRSRSRQLSGGPYARNPKPFKSKPHHIVCSSGETPLNHPGIAEAAEEGTDPLPVEYWDTFECAGGVNLVTLLRATRASLIEHITHNVPVRVNALVREHWETTVCGPKHGIYRVQIRYSGVAVRSSKPDARRPVALGQAKGIPGLMTILKRNDA